MNKLKDEVIGFLNMGLHPTVISFRDDGLYYLFDKLLQGTTTSNSYDPTFTFVHIPLSDIDGNITPELIEKRIHDSLTRDNFEGDTIFETYSNDVETVCILDDIAYLDNVAEAINSADILIRKYRGILHFVYVVEDPMLVSKLKGKILSSSSFFDALMYQEVGQSWEFNDLINEMKKQFHNSIPQDELNQIEIQSNKHFGTFKRLFKDKLIGTKSAQRYIELLIEELDPNLLNTFKKVLKNKQLSHEENEIIHYYQKVGFIKESDITIPLMKDLIDGAIVKDKISYDIEQNELTGLDLNQFNNIEKQILEVLFSTSNVVTKSSIGDIIWGENAPDKYSEWAIDQRIGRLRKKIIDLGFNIDIQTIYGQGYKLAIIERR